MQENILEDDMARNNQRFKEKILDEIRENYDGHVLYGNDLDII